ncbi:MAG: hypothetical protein J6M06_04305, partial [Synergistaceae bacterium]|nr:hypothetical protein [Synergistaceae bacterium]
AKGEVRKPFRAPNLAFFMAHFATRPRAVVFMIRRCFIRELYFLQPPPREGTKTAPAVLYKTAFILRDSVWLIMRRDNHFGGVLCLCS